MITRRTLLASGAIFAAIPSVAQPKEGPFRAGLQWAGQALTPENSPWMQAFTEELERLGYVGGKNLEFETRTAGGDTKRLPDLAAELLALRPDVILVSTTASLMALANQHATVPVVFTIGVDPIGLGIVQSLAHPGGYFTGLFNNAGDVLPRSLQMLRDLLPQARRVGSLIDPSFGPKITAEFLEHMNAAADRLGFEFKAIEVTSPEQLPSVFDQLEKFKAEAFFLGTGGPLSNQHRQEIIELLRAHRLPSIHAFRVDAAAGGLMSYGSDMDGLFRTGAVYVDKIFRGANPADLRWAGN